MAAMDLSTGFLPILLHLCHGTHQVYPLCPLPVTLNPSPCFCHPPTHTHPHPFSSLPFWALGMAGIRVYLQGFGSLLSRQITIIPKHKRDSFVDPFSPEVSCQHLQMQSCVLQPIRPAHKPSQLQNESIWSLLAAKLN